MEVAQEGPSKPELALQESKNPLTGLGWGRGRLGKAEEQNGGQQSQRRTASAESRDAMEWKGHQCVGSMGPEGSV